MQSVRLILTNINEHPHQAEDEEDKEVYEDEFLIPEEIAFT